MKFAQIHPRAFAHPDDVKATQSLAHIPALSLVMKKISKFRLEEAAHYRNSLSAVRLGPSQFVSLYRMVGHAADVLGLPRIDAYLMTSPHINAFAFGCQHHTITLTSALVDTMPDEEIQAIIAHELGHIVCEHMLYKSMGRMLANQAVRHVLPSKLLAGTLELAILAWSRASEYSADRAALLVCQDARVVASALGRLAGGSVRFGREFDARSLLAQIDGIEEQQGWLNKVSTLQEEVLATHPEPVKRAAEIMRWSRSEQYRAILEGRYLTKAEHRNQRNLKIKGVASCAHCRAPTGRCALCPQCGMSQDPKAQVTCANGHTIDVTWKFCKICGMRQSPPHTPERGTPAMPSGEQFNE